MATRLKIGSVKGKEKDITVLTLLSITAYMILIGFLIPDMHALYAVTVGWFAAGLMCIWNFKSCRRFHCIITGPGFLGIGILSLMEAIGMISLQEWIEWAIILAVLAIGFGSEYLYKSREGTCHCQTHSK
jgi:O-antigen/teichoic acid export membrane protein